MVGTGTGLHAPDPTRAFRERARLEADRYGPDPWIFVRELLQNSRDAGASTVHFVVEQDETTERVICTDDGDGMTFEHARRYLFSLYASSKEGTKNQAGKFGVGFWSVLRFEPAAIQIRSAPRAGAPWGLRLAGSLAHATHTAPLDRWGTEIVLERPRGDGRLEHRVFDAVWQSARYLHHRDSQDRPVTILVNGRQANAEFGLAAPSTSFRRRAIRGVVGLGPAPRVELFCRGLRVRAAACLEDLVAPAGRHTSRMRVTFPELPGGLAPHALLESDRLELLLSRSDARDNRALQKLVRLAQSELERLVERQLAHARPQPWWRRAWHRLHHALLGSAGGRVVLGAGIGALIAFGLSTWLWGGGPAETDDAVAVAKPPSQLAASAEPEPYRDLAERYRGPKIDVLSPGAAEPIELRYRPANSRLHLAALTLAHLADDGSPMRESLPDALARYATSPCTEDCIELELPTVTEAGATRLPIPTGHRVVQGSVRLDGEPVELRALPDGHPVIYTPTPRSGTLSYRTLPAPDPAPPQVPTSRVRLPSELRRLTDRLEALPIAERVETLVASVRRSVRYDRSPEVASRLAEATERGIGFIDRTLAIGAGDCDVQNGLLVALLHASGVQARLAVGYIGNRGATMPWLHAWAEYRSEDGRWHVADASDRIAPETVVAVAGGPPGPDAGPAIVGSDAGDGDPDPGPTPAIAAPSPLPPDPVIGAGATQPEISPPPETIAATSPAPAPPAPPASTWTRLAELDRRVPYLLRAVPIFFLGLGVWLIAGSRTRRAIKLDDSADLSRLLQGVLQQPGAFNHVSALFHRPLVPLCDGSAISLHRARELSALGRLYRTRDRSSLATRAIRSGAAVLDDATAEGRTVADALGAVDLDRWSALAERSRTDGLITGINAALRNRREEWFVRTAVEANGPLSVLDLRPIGVQFPGVKGTRLVIVDEHDPVLTRARALARENPRAGVLLALDHLAGRLGLPERQRGRLLSEAARIAVLEAFGQ